MDARTEKQATERKAKVDDAKSGKKMVGRRKALRLSLLAGGGLFAAFAGLKMMRPGFAEYGKLQVLSEYEADILYALGDAILPRGKGWPSLEDADVIHRMDEELYFLDPANASDFKSVLMLVEYFPLTFGYFSRFTRLDRRERLEFLKRTHEADDPMVNVAVNAPRSMLTYVYYGHEKTWPMVGYDGPFGGFPPKLGEQRRYYQQLRAQS